MPYDMNWHDDEKSIIRIDITGDVEWAGFHDVINQTADALKQAPRRVDIIFHDRVGMPPGNPLPHLKTSVSKLADNPKTGLIYVVSPDQISRPVQMLISIVMRVYGIDTSHVGGFVHTMEQAIDGIMRDRASVATAV